jgi:hypothetical protein
MKLPQASSIPVTLFICSLTALALFLRLALPQLAAALEMSPAGTLMRGMVWTPLTTGMAESWSPKAAALLALTLAGGAFVEPIVSSREFAKHVFFVQLASSCIALLTASVLYAMTYREEFFFTAINGLAGMDAAILVLVAQTPHAANTKIPGTELDARLAVLPFLLAYTLLAAKSDGLRFTDVLQMWPAFFVAVKRVSTAEFSLDSFVPEPARPSVKSMFDGLCRFWPKALGGADSGASAAVPDAERLPPLPTDSVAERRRARALKALDRKLAEMEAEPEVALDAEDAR